MGKRPLFVFFKIATHYLVVVIFLAFCYPATDKSFKLITYLYRQIHLTNFKVKVTAWFSILRIPKRIIRHASSLIVYFLSIICKPFHNFYFKLNYSLTLYNLRHFKELLGISRVDFILSFHNENLHLNFSLPILRLSHHWQ